MYKLIVLSIVITVALSAALFFEPSLCYAQNEETRVPAADQIRYTPGLMPPESMSYILSSDEDTEVARTMHYIEILMACSRLDSAFCNKSASWQEIAVNVGSVIERWKDSKLFYQVAQCASNGFLATDGLYEDMPTSECLNAVGYYIDLAVDNYYPGADLISKALQFLKQHGYWGEERIKIAAFKARSYALTYLYLEFDGLSNLDEALRGKAASERVISNEEERNRAIALGIKQLDELLKGIVRREAEECIKF